ncbi:MAG: PTS fructose transporter subunit IIA [Planctomycetota bacterium]
MIGILILTHGALGEALLRSAGHVLGSRPVYAETIEIVAGESPETILEHARQALAKVDQGHGVLVLTDIFGATPANTALKLLLDGEVEGISGVNLPMLLRALTHRAEPLADVVEKSRAGAVEGIVHMNRDLCRNC